MTLSSRLREILRGCGLTHHQVASRAGVSASVVYRFLNGERSPTLATVDRIATVLKLKLIAPGGKPSKRDEPHPHPQS